MLSQLNLEKYIIQTSHIIFIYKGYNTRVFSKLFFIFRAMDFSSKLLENAVNEMSQLPGIGKRTALRLVLHMLKQPPQQTQGLAQSLVFLREQINFCSSCHNLSDATVV